MQNQLLRLLAVAHVPVPASATNFLYVRLFIHDALNGVVKEKRHLQTGTCCSRLEVT